MSPAKRRELRAAAEARDAAKKGGRGKESSGRGGQVTHRAPGTGKPTNRPLAQAPSPADRANAPGRATGRKPRKNKPGAPRPAYG